MTAGQFDLSVGSITAFTSVIVANLALSHSLGFSVLVAVAAAIGVGALNGFLVTVVGRQRADHDARDAGGVPRPLERGREGPDARRRRALAASATTGRSGTSRCPCSC